MMVIKSKGMAFHGFSWIVLLVHLFIRTSWMDCDWMWDDVSHAGWESRNSEYPWGLEELESAFQLERFKATSSEKKHFTSQCLLLLPRMWDHWDGVRNAKAPPKWQQVLLSSVPGDGDVQVACVFLCVTVAFRCTKLILRFWVSACIGRPVQEGLAYCTCKCFHDCLWFVVPVLILYRMPSAWRNKPMRSKT